MKYRSFILAFILLNLLGIPDGLRGQSIYKVKQITSRANDEIVSGFSQNGILYSSNKPLTSFLKYTDQEQRNIFNMWEMPFDEEGNPGTPRIYAPELKTSQNDGPASLDGEGKLIVFTRNFSLKKFGNIRSNNPRYGLFLADRENEVWVNIREFEHNTSDSRTTHPSLSADGKTLYFASDREGGYGGFDLYVSRFVNGRWSEPENLGPKVNTAVNDIYPSIHSSGRLYFSSEGHVRAGGYDIYYTELYNNDWTEPVKLAAPFNSAQNDFSILLDENYENGYVTSTRRGSMGIFKIELTLPTFDVCKLQKPDNFCFVFFERNTMEIDTSLYRYVWDLGDGTKQEAVEAEHCFSGPGTYLISLDVVDVLTKEVMFNQAEYELELKKSIQPFITCPDTVMVGQDLQLSGIETYLGEAVPAEYYWDFGDGGRAVGVSVTYRYMVPGKHNVKLGVAEESAENEAPNKHCSYKTVMVLSQ